MSDLQFGPVLAPSWGLRCSVDAAPFHLDPLLFWLHWLLLRSHCANVQMPLNENLPNCFYRWPRVSGWLKSFQLAGAKAKMLGNA